MADKPPAPCHIVRGSSTYTLCGIHRRTRAAFPYCAPQWVQRNVLGQGLPLCDDCWEAWRDQGVEP